jgi:hypothetical protein
MQFDRTIGSIRVVNAGSVGMPYGEPGAYWLLVGPTLQFRRTSYDRTQAGLQTPRLVDSRSPAFAPQNVLHLPSEAEALEAFTRMEESANEAD